MQLWLETFLTSTSYLEIFVRLAEMTLTDLVLLFLISKPVFVIIAMGAVISGQVQWTQRSLATDRGRPHRME
jgi:hypothetical protein